MQLTMSHSSLGRKGRDLDFLELPARLALLPGGAVRVRPVTDFCRCKSGEGVIRGGGLPPKIEKVSLDGQSSNTEAGEELSTVVSRGRLVGVTPRSRVDSCFEGVAGCWGGSMFATSKPKIDWRCWIGGEIRRDHTCKVSILGHINV